MIVKFIPAVGQTEFKLPFSPEESATYELKVNDVNYINGLEYSVIGNILVWNNVEFALDDKDVVVLNYTTRTA